MNIVHMFKKKAFFTTACLIFCFVVASCGYHRAERSAELPSWIKSIYIVPWQNRSNELLLAAWITDELRQEFLRGSSLSLAAKEDADVILEGQVKEVATSGLSYVRHDQAIERRIDVVCTATLKDRRTGEIIWTTADIVREESFLVGKEATETEALKNKALKKLSRDVAELIYHRIGGVF